MKKFRLVFLLMIVALLLPSTAYARDLKDDKVIFGGTYTLQEGETLNGNLVVFGGAVTLEAETTVNGDVVLMGGTVDAAGVVNGNMVGIGGVLQLGDASQVNGDLVTIGASLQRDDGAQINGQVIRGMSFPFQLDFSSNAENFGENYHPSTVTTSNPLLEAMWFFFRMFMWAALAVLLVIFFLPQSERVAKAALDLPLITVGAGLLTALLSPLALLALVVTIILIPVGLALVVLLGIAWLLGWVALGLEVGRRIAKMLNQDWAPAIAAGVGTFILYFVLAGFDQLVPCVGGLPRMAVGLWGLGAVLLTYFGTREFQSTPTIVETPQIADVIKDRTVGADVEEAALPDDGLTSEGEPPEANE